MTQPLTRAELLALPPVNATMRSVILRFFFLAEPVGLLVRLLRRLGGHEHDVA